MRALVYCRVSTTGQEEKGTSLDSQATECTAFAKERGYTVVEAVKEVFSGAYLFDRPKLNLCREKLREGAYDAVIVYAIDRLSRDVAHLAIIADEVERAGAELLFVTEDLDKTAEGKLMLSVKAFVGEVERLKIRERSMRGKRAIVNAGKLFAPSCNPYGYGFDKENRVRTLVDHEAEIVRRIYREFVEDNLPMRSIMVGLNSEAIPSPADRKKTFRNYQTFRHVAEKGHTLWHSGTIHRILKNPMYTGKTFALCHESDNGYKDGKRYQRPKLKPQSEWVELGEGITPAIVSAELYNAAQAKLKANVGNGTRNETRPALLRGLIYCGCGSKMAPAWSHPNKSQPDYVYFNYRCRSGAGTVRCGTPGAQLNGTKIEAAVWGRVTEILSNPETLRLELEQRQEVGESERQEVAQRIDQTNAAVSKLNNEITRLVERMALVDDAVFAVVQKQIDTKSKELKKLQTILRDSERRLASFDNEVTDIAALETYCTTFGDNLGRLEFQDKRMIVEALGLNVVGNAGKARVSISIPTSSEVLNSIGTSVPSISVIETKGPIPNNTIPFTFPVEL